ncbi:MAG: ROK family protein [Candidatus Thermoplasmatota archaeon]|jgi:glucokinase|nr:ROK family protein [Candidatus Thermoplasmatota archaeon]MCL5785897.1 ROK family protein [Candidatus Thermoplasmatota archaeon]
MKILGFDVGGTKISASIGEENGTIVQRTEVPTTDTMDGNEMTRTLVDLGSEVMRLAGIDLPDSVGITFAGFIDFRKGMVISSPNIPGIKNFPVSSIVSDFFQSKVYLENDANAAAIAEHVFGSGIGKRDFVYVTLSTGIGAGIFANGKLLTGKNGLGGEVGHMKVTDKPFICGCGRTGCFEAAAGGAGIVRRTIGRMASSKAQSTLRKMPLAELSAKNILNAAYAGDKLAEEILQETIHYLGIGLANLAILFDPETIILGGGIMQNRDQFLVEVKASFEREMDGMFRKLDIVKSMPDVADLAAISLPAFYGHRKN